MAVTKTHPIKSTLKAAIDYICNPEKTDGKLLVSAHGCAAETADIEFSWTRRHCYDPNLNGQKGIAIMIDQRPPFRYAPLLAG